MKKRRSHSTPARPPNRRTYTALGNLLRTARSKPPGTSVPDVARLLGVKPTFVYLVEEGLRKPKDGNFGKWASVYGVRYADMWKCLDRIPMDLVGSLREEPAPVDPFTLLTELEKSELLPFLEYVRWKITKQAARKKGG